MVTLDVPLPAPAGAPAAHRRAGRLHPRRRRAAAARRDGGRPVAVHAASIRCSPTRSRPSSRRAPSTCSAPTSSGRDQFSRVIYGARLSLGMGFGATLIGLTAGLVLGLLAGLSRGWVDRVLSRVIDVLYAFPEMLLAIIAVAVLGTGFSTLLLAIGIGSIPSYARVLRSQVLQVRSSGYAEAAVTLGQRPALIAWRHVLPELDRPRARARDDRGGHGDHLRLGAQLRRARRAAADARVGSHALRQPQLPHPRAVARAVAGRVPRRHRRSRSRSSAAGCSGASSAPWEVSHDRHARPSRRRRRPPQPRRSGGPARSPVLSVRDLAVTFPRRAGDDPRGARRLVRHRARGSASRSSASPGSGKSVTARALLGVAGADASVARGAPQLGRRSTSAGLTERQWRGIRGRRIALVLQDALSSLDPLRRVGAEVAEPLDVHDLVPPRPAQAAGARAAVERRRSPARGARAPVSARALGRAAPARADRVGAGRRTRARDRRRADHRARRDRAGADPRPARRAQDARHRAAADQPRPRRRRPDRRPRAGHARRRRRRGGADPRRCSRVRGTSTRAACSTPCPGPDSRGRRLSDEPGDAVGRRRRRDRRSRHPRSRRRARDGPAQDLPRARAATTRSPSTTCRSSCGGPRSSASSASPGRASRRPRAWCSGSPSPTPAAVEFLGEPWSGVAEARAPRAPAPHPAHLAGPARLVRPAPARGRDHRRGARARRRPARASAPAEVERLLRERRPAGGCRGPASRRRCPAGSASASRSRAPWPPGPTSSSATRRSRRSTCPIQAQVLDLLADLRDRTGVALLFISHDLGVIHHIADRVLVMKDGPRRRAGRRARRLHRARGIRTPSSCSPPSRTPPRATPDGPTGTERIPDAQD